MALTREAAMTAVNRSVVFISLELLRKLAIQTFLAFSQNVTVNRLLKMFS